MRLLSCALSCIRALLDVANDGHFDTIRQSCIGNAVNTLILSNSVELLHTRKEGLRGFTLQYSLLVQRYSKLRIFG